MRLMIIRWLDSCGVTGEWEDREALEPMPPIRCTSVGLVIEETAESITLVQTVSKDQVLGRITIPLGCITERSELRGIEVGEG